METRISLRAASFLRGAANRAVMLGLGVALLAPLEITGQSSSSVPAGSEGGGSAVWIFANLSFTAMRAQNKGSGFWKVVTFICGFPGTLLTLIVVEKGSERAYGIDMPRKQMP